MELSKMKPATGSRKRRKLLGRGESSGSGKTSGRGGKGQTARSGGTIHRGFEGGQMPLYRRLPKRGFTSGLRANGVNRHTIVTLSFLNRFDEGATVDLDAMKKAGLSLSSKHKGGIKILSRGELTKKLNLKVSAISASARKAVESLGGTVEVLA